MSRTKRGVIVTIPTDQMVPADLVQQLPLGDPQTLWMSPNASANGGIASSEDEGHDYWARATGRQNPPRLLGATASVIRIEKTNGTSGTTGAKDSADDENDGYWARARGVAPRHPSPSGRPVPPPQPAALSLVPPPVTKDLESESAPVSTPMPAATEIETTTRGTHVRKVDRIVAPVLGAHVKAEDPLADAAWHTRLAEDEMLNTTVSGAHVKADDPLVSEVQAAHALGAVAPLDEPLAPQGTEAAPEPEVFMVGPSEVDSSEAATLQAAEDSAGDVLDRPRRRRWHLVPVAGAAAALAAGLGGGGAYAYFTSHGSGTGHTATGSAQGTTVTAVASPTADANLYPGGLSVAVNFTVNNPNPYAVSFTGWSGASIATVTPVGSNTCLPGDFQIASGATSGTFSPALSVPSGSPGVSGTANGVMQLKTTAQNGCQGSTVTVTLTLTGGKSS